MIDRVKREAIRTVNVDRLAEALGQIELLEGWIKDARKLAQELIESGIDVPGWKLVPKRATRQWIDENKAFVALLDMGLNADELAELRSPAQIEKVLKKRNLALPDNVVTSVSSGNTLAPADDPRPSALQIGKQLSAALGKLV
jgi:hypothetical protein